MSTIANIINYFSNNAVSFRVLIHPPLYQVRELAQAHRVSKSEVAQITVFEADRRYGMSVVPGDGQLDSRALCDVLNAAKIELLQDWDLERLFPGCDIGAAPPFGNLYGVQVVADASFEQGGRMVFMLCSHATSLSMSWSDFKRLVNPIVASIAESTSVLEDSHP